ncbi:DNA primase [Streptomyces sp. NPDC052109]|uniref:DNA primase n=1 Tax=Streptomyces sp. NPDC052109 TaxID=3155527 RepID=UPI00344AEFDE
MMNRTALGLAIGAGYLLGRTKKLKMALAVGSMVAGKKLNLGPGALAAMARQQLRDNPQFKEIGDQLRQDLRGVGKAASGAMVERQMGALADRLHDRTSQVRDGLSGALPDSGSEEEQEDDDQDRAARRDDGGKEREDDDQDRAARRDDGGKEREDDDGDARRQQSSGKKAPAKKASAGRKTAERKTAPAKKAAARKTGTAGKKTSGTRGAGSSKGGDDR